MSYLQSLNS